MEDQKKEFVDTTMFELFYSDKKLLRSAVNVINMTSNFVDLVYDKYPGITNEEVATFAMQLFWDVCHFGNMKKEDIIKLANEILNAM